MGDGKPIAVNLEVSRLATIGKRLASNGELWTKTYYVGKSSIFRAVATTAHCAIEGYEPTMVETSAIAYFCKQSLRVALAKSLEDYREEKSWHEVSRRNLNPKQGAARPAYVRSTSGGVRGPLEAVDTLPILVEKPMDLSDVAVRHAIAVSPVNIRHSIDLSPSAVSIAREIRFCIIAAVVGFTAASIVKSALVYKRSSQ